MHRLFSHRILPLPRYAPGATWSGQYPISISLPRFRCFASVRDIGFCGSHCALRACVHLQFTDGDDPSSSVIDGLRRAGGGSSMVFFRSCSFTSLGMTGFDSVISSVRLLLFGMATVPDTHLLHQIIADNLVSKASRIADGVLARLSPAPLFAMAA